MCEIDYKSLKKGIKMFYLFVFFGLIFGGLFFYVFMLGENKKKSLDREVRTDYIDPNTYYDDDDGTLMYSPIYYYTVNGKQYSCSSNFSSSSAPGESGTVYYKKGNPSNCMTDFALNTNKFFLIGVGIGLIVVVVGIIPLISKKKEIRRIKKLATTGKIIKGIPYTMEDTNTSINGKTIKKIAIDYTLPNGEVAHLTGNPRYDGKISDEDGLVDLLIDPNNYKNYFIDFDLKWSGPIRVETYNGPIPKSTQNVNTEINQTIQNAANIAESVGNTINQVNNIVGKDTIITFGGNSNDKHC